MAGNYNNIEVPTYSNPLKPVTKRVKFKFDDPRITDKETYTIYNWGVVDVETGEDAYLSGFAGIYKALTNLANVPDNDDDEGNPIKPYTVKQGTVVDVGCFQSNPSDPKTKRYGASWVSGPVQLVGDSTPSASPQPQQQQPAQPKYQPPQGEPMMSKQQIQNGNKYKPMTTDRLQVAAAQINDLGQTLRMAWEYVNANFAEVKEHNRRAMAIHLNMDIAFHNHKYTGLYEQNDQNEEDVSGSNADIVAISKMLSKAPRDKAFLDYLVDNTDTENEFSIKGCLHSIGINVLPSSDYNGMMNILERVNRYYTHRAAGLESKEAAAEVMKEYPNIE